MCSLTLLWCVGLSRFSRVWLFVTEWTVACRAPLSIGFSRQGLPFPAPGIFLTQGLNPCLLHLLHWPAGSSPLALSGKPNLIVVIMLNHDVQTITLYMLKDELRHIKKFKSLLSKNRFEWSGVKLQAVKALHWRELRERPSREKVKAEWGTDWWLASASSLMGGLCSAVLEFQFHNLEAYTNLDFGLLMSAAIAWEPHWTHDLPV